MARPRVFVSSTYYDLKHVRASLDLFAQSLGFESVLSEKGDIAYAFDRPLDESCYAEVSNADLFVIVVGGRYGSAASDQSSTPSADFYKRYDSITRKEYERAHQLDIPLYILVDKSVHAEYQTYLHNRDAEISYAHVDSVNVFRLLEDILNQPRNNALATFERFTDIETWLRDQWSGLFRELLKRSSQQSQLRELSEQVSEMRELNVTLKKYLETVMSEVVPTSRGVIESEEKRIVRASYFRALEHSQAAHWIADRLGVSTSSVAEVLSEAETLASLREGISAMIKRSLGTTDLPDGYVVRELMIDSGTPVVADIDEVRVSFDRAPIDPNWADEATGRRAATTPEGRLRARSSLNELRSEDERRRLQNQVREDRAATKRGPDNNGSLKPRPRSG